MATSIRRRGNSASNIVKSVKSGARREVAVGFPAGANGARIHSQADMPIYQLAAIHQFGSPSRNIPARDFMGLGNEMIIKKTRPTVERGIIAVNRNPENINQMMNAVARISEAEMKNAINNLKSPPNATSTVAIKESANPLVDTGEMMNSVTAIVRDAR